MAGAWRALGKSSRRVVIHGSKYCLQSGMGSDKGMAAATGGRGYPLDSAAPFSVSGWPLNALFGTMVVGTDGPPGVQYDCHGTGRTGEARVVNGDRMSCEFGNGSGRSGVNAAKR
jgi:hypothetical protein